jgi:hypothetical protein
MLGPDKKTTIVPVAGVVETSLDYSVTSDSYSLRIESFDQRLVVITDDSGAKAFLDLFDNFVDRYLELREAYGK